MNRIDFMGVIIVDGANPNGDPTNGNRPRTDYEGLGEITSVCIKRKIRNRLQDDGQRIFVQSNERSDDGCKSLDMRLKTTPGFDKKMSRDTIRDICCQHWFDVRAFGQVFAFKGTGDASVPVRGPVTISFAKSLTPVFFRDYAVTRSVNAEETGDKRASDTFGNKSIVDRGVYVFHGGIHPQLAEKTGFSDDDVPILKRAILHMFNGDESSFRPAGSMELHRLFWWEHDCRNGVCSPARVFRSVSISPSDQWPFYDVDMQAEGTRITMEEYVCGELVK
ncbi:type I-C CRISPR-associated protein Cas7/Csd2 [Agathobaculum sp. NTUH-O15-33]|uniref:type I-C CRISPR-associated protein Cas7/Csd2 n=1 Tax=Agathobaculum sp. NTUH-O15-33 TaxID=3079302 RepID=UPI002958BE7A|nr:type I-C CRISPR-associated protein Cas7/Csd2 [Agathobaculum sp. NTUH-O15-33]WNX85270.1 type I-C CRISPR-associated protein Cas7/Csd2 [Agathobaculum sp. NTUH-O15-33]